MGTWYASALFLPPLAVTRSRGLIDWRIVAWAGGATFLLVAGVVSAILLADHRASALKKVDSSLVVASLSQRSESGHKTEPQQLTGGDRKSDVSQPAVPPVVVYLPPPAPAERPVPFGLNELPASEQTVTGAAIAFENFGTQLAFAASPAEAVDLARTDRRIDYSSRRQL